METQDISEFARDLIGLQSEIQHLKKDVQGYGYKYANLTQTLDAILNELANKYGFAVMQFGHVVGGEQTLKTILLHKSGISFAGDVLLKGDPVSRGEDKNGVSNVPALNDPQEFGSWWTYVRRYSLQGAFGLTAEDNDGASSTNKKPRNQSVQPPGPKPNDLSSYQIDFGQYNGKILKDIPPAKLDNYIKYLEGSVKKSGKQLSQDAAELVAFGNEYLNLQRGAPVVKGAPQIDDGVAF